MTTRHHHGQSLKSRRTRVSFTLPAIYAGSRGGYRAEKPEYFRDLRGGIERRMLAIAFAEIRGEIFAPDFLDALAKFFFFLLCSFELKLLCYTVRLVAYC